MKLFTERERERREISGGRLGCRRSGVVESKAYKRVKDAKDMKAIYSEGKRVDIVIMTSTAGDLILIQPLF